MQHMSGSIFVLALAVALLVACGGGSNSGSDAGEVNCQNDPRVLTYAPNVTVPSASGGMRDAPVQSDPAPPAKGNDTWKLKVTTAAPGQGMPGLHLKNQTLMPDHGPGPPRPPPITHDPGRNYTVAP